MDRKDDAHFMRLAIAAAARGIAVGQTPFGACIVKKGRVVLGHNAVWSSGDITAHAEMVAIRRACRAFKTTDLSGATIYSTCEPCPMCFAACHWAGIQRIVFGCRIRDAAKIGFREMTVSNVVLKRLGKSPLEVTRGILRPEALGLFSLWLKQPGRKAY